jgi:hypothetical protein
VAAFRKGCTVNQGAAIVAIILNNLTSHPPQTLFYKISLNAPCGPGPVARVRTCRAGTKAAGFYFKRNPFGVLSEWTIGFRSWDNRFSPRVSVAGSLSIYFPAFGN